MADKKRVSLPLANDVGHTFEDQDRILNYRPKIQYVAPPTEQDGARIDVPNPSSGNNLDNLRKRTEDIIKGYEEVKALAEVAKKRIDDRVEAAGGLTITLDPNRDAHTIAALKRQFPDLPDHTKLDYKTYKQAMNCARVGANPPPAISIDDIKAAKADPYRTDFGGRGNLPGANRPEISNPANPIPPIDINAFQAAGIIALFGLLLPQITADDQKTIAQHLASAPHKPF